jgi:soluble cytochrome b562
MDSFQCRDSDSSDDESSDKDPDSDEVDDCCFDSGFDIQIDSLDSSDFVSKEGNIYHLSTVKEKFLNDGKSRMSGQSRKKGLPELTFPKCQ